MSNKTVRSLTCVVSLLAVLQTASAKEITQDDLFPRDRVLDVQITVEEADWDTIRYQTRNFQTALAPERQFAPPKSPYTYVNAKVSIDGVDLGTVGIRKKGFLGSQNSNRPSLKIKLNHVDKKGGVAGLTNLTFNNNQQDTTLMSQFMGYALFNEAGIPAPRCAYAVVTVNGSKLGVYTHVETPREPLLQRGFGTTGGTLFEGTVTDFFANWENSFERETGKSKPGIKKIKQLIAAFEPVNEPGDNILSSTAQGHGIVPENGELEDKWTAPDFDDSQWKAGQNGAGYETQSGYEQHISEAFNIEGEPGGHPTAVYLRFAFQIDDLEQVRKSGDLILRMKYDDGFVAWLNGHRIASANAPEELEWNSQATASHGDEAAVQFESFIVAEHEDKLRSGRNVLAIQGLNVNAKSTDMLIAAELETNDLAAKQARAIDLIAETVDLDAFYQFWAVEGLLGFWDGYCANRNNYFVYLHPQTDKLYFMPWGADSLFVKFSKLRNDPRSPLSVKTQGRIAYTLYQTKQGRQRISQTMAKLLEEHWHEDELLAEVDRLEKMLKPHVAVSQWWSFRTGPLREFIRNRRGDIEAELKRGLPIYTRVPGPPPIITDFKGRRQRRARDDAESRDAGQKGQKEQKEQNRKIEPAKQ